MAVGVNVPVEDTLGSLQLGSGDLRRPRAAAASGPSGRWATRRHARGPHHQKRGFRATTSDRLWLKKHDMYSVEIDGCMLDVKMSNDEPIRKS